MICHHSRREGISSGGGEDPGEQRKKEVWVSIDGVVEACLSEREQCFILLRGGLKVVSTL